MHFTCSKNVFNFHRRQVTTGVEILKPKLSTQGLLFALRTIDSGMWDKRFCLYIWIFFYSEKKREHIDEIDRKSFLPNKHWNTKKILLCIQQIGGVVAVVVVFHREIYLSKNGAFAESKDDQKIAVNGKFSQAGRTDSPGTFHQKEFFTSQKN